MLEDSNLDKSSIPEGYDVDRIAIALEKANIISKDEFISAVKEYKLPSYIKSNNERKYDLEGFLFPDTYSFKKGVSGEEIIKTMNGRFDEVIKDLTKEKPLKMKSYIT
ncbi:endolytic transglycosylase MltG [Clostridium sp. Marseille-QA1073]